MEVTYKGYTCITYGKSSMKILDSTGKEVMHTANRNEKFCKTRFGLMDQIEGYLRLKDISREMAERANKLRTAYKPMKDYGMKEQVFIDEFVTENSLPGKNCGAEMENEDGRTTKHL